MEQSFEFQAMGSPCEIRMQGPDASRLEAAARLAIDEVHRIEAKYSRYRDDSVVAKINAAAGTSVRVPLDAETTSLLAFASSLHAYSEGRFDITSGVLRRCWHFQRAVLPDPEALAQALALVGWPRVEQHADGLRLPLAGMQIDLGGLGKEYACDRAAAVLLDAGQHHGWVNLGGDIRVIGPRRDGSPWRFGIQHPRDPQGVIASIELASGGLATSGDYERFIEVGGRRYGHLLDARTGWPVAAWRSVSVVAPTCSAAGAASTLACLMADAAPAFLRAQGTPYLLVNPQGRLVPGGGWPAHLLNLSNLSNAETPCNVA